MTGFHVTQADLKLTNVVKNDLELLILSRFQCWDYRHTTRGLCNAGGWAEGFLQLGKHSAYHRAIALQPQLFLFF